jgi:hypothetical protein
MTTIRNLPAVLPARSLAAAEQRSDAAPSRVASEVADRFERAGPRERQLVAGNVVGPLTTLVLGAYAMGVGISTTLTGFDPRRVAPRPQMQPAELVVPQRGLGGV